MLRTVVCSVLVTFQAVFVLAAEPLELKKGDHICILGNTLAERMQHYCWLETLIHAQFPEHELVFRNLGYSGDEIDGWQNPNHRMRSMAFGSQDEWLAGNAPIPQPNKLAAVDADKVRQNRFELTNTRADVIFAFYGYNESFAGEEGLAKFKENVTAFIDHTLSQKYNGKSAPKMVLFSPHAVEYLRDSNLLTLEQVRVRNAQIQLYVEAMKSIADTKNICFVDLFTRTEKFGRTDTFQGQIRPTLTINGIHLNHQGDRWIAEIAMDQLIKKPIVWRKDSQWVITLEPLRQAVNDKNFYWFNRYRVTDGYSTYGDRAFLKFTQGPGGYDEKGMSNYVVGQRELEVLDQLTANRDKVVWAAAQGQKVEPNDGDLLPFIPVVSNKPGPLEGGQHLFLNGEDSISKMTVGKGLKVELFADEKMFPELINPVQMAFDTKGRLWVAAWPTYPHWKPTEQMNDKLLILEDTNGDGKADVCKTFTDDIHNPTGFEFWNGGVIVAQGPDLLFLKDTDGDDKYDIKERILHGLDTADTHHTANSFTLDPGGALYFQEGTFHHTQVETAWGPATRVANGAVFRYEPRAQKFDVYTSYGFANPHGHAFDAWGQDIVIDGTGAVPYHGTVFSGHMNFPEKHRSAPTVYQQRTRPCPAIEFLYSRHFPEEFFGNFLVGNVIGFQGILRYKVYDESSSLGATELEPILYSSDPNFRPADLETAPDGSLYFTDWQNPIIGHMQHNLRDPSRDRQHGRVYRVTYEGRPLVKPTPIAGESIENLVNVLLNSDENRVRYRARIELSSRPTKDVLAVVDQMTTKLQTATGSDVEHQLLEMLWVHQQHNVVDAALLNRVLFSPDFRARSAAVKVLCAWRDRVSNALPLLKKLAADDHPRVRLEAVRAASFFTEPDAVEVALISTEHPTDKYIDYVRTDAMRTFEPYWQAALARQETIPVTSEIATRFFLAKMALEQLLKLERTRLVNLELLFRPGMIDELRREGLQGVAHADQKTEVQVLLDAIHTIDEKRDNRDERVIYDLVRLLTMRRGAELADARAELKTLALTAQQPVIRQIGYTALINVDGSVENAWNLSLQSISSLRDLLAAMPMISDPTTRAALYPHVEPLLQGLPKSLSHANSSKGTLGRFVRIELKGKRTLTLAEVEVLSNGRNVARQGTATQKNTSNGGDASRAIDGNANGSFGAGGQTHTAENTVDPWWEVDLGEIVPIETVRIFNRTEGDLGNRLDKFSLIVLDGARAELFRQDNLPAPNPSAEYQLPGNGPANQIRHAAMMALVSVRGEEVKTFNTLAALVQNDADRLPAIRALQRIPRHFWPSQQALPIIEQIIGSVRKIPVADRTSPDAVDSLEFADALVSLLPSDQAKPIRATLRELGVRVIRIGTIFERMSYDKDFLVVQAGKPVEFLLENSDLMPHNFVLTQPGTMEEVGLLSEKLAQDPAHALRQFVPPSDKILLASRLLPPRESQKLSFTAPQQPGVYPYVCTYPGHWRRMYGALYVVPDLDAYEADPEGYLAANKISPVDALLKDRRPRTEWTFEELADDIQALKHGRNYGSAKRMFQVANCVGCHKLEGVGNEFGPDLTKLDPKWNAPEILKEILDPSAKINEKFQPYSFELSSGKVVTGLIVEETPDFVKVLENPLVSKEPVKLARGDILERVKSQTSIMPKGLLDKLTKEEILDLVAYVTSKGNKAHAVFSGDEHHDHKH